MFPGKGTVKLNELTSKWMQREDMGKASRHRILAWQVLLLGCMGVWLCVCSPGIAWAETVDSPPGSWQGERWVQQEERPIFLEDGTIIELTEDAVMQKGKSPDIPNSTNETVL